MCARHMIKIKTKKATIDRSDLLAAWAVLENLAVSLDQIGGLHGVSGSKRNGPNHPSRNGASSNRALQKALCEYLTPDLLRTIRDARTRLGQYLSDADAEKIADSIRYWDYRGNRNGSRRKP